MWWKFMKKKHRVGGDTATSAYITTYIDKKREQKVSKNEDKYPENKMEDNKNILDGEE